MMPKTTKAATDEEVSLWYCEDCCNSGAILLEPHIDVYSVVNMLEDAHAKASPKCRAPIGTVRIVRPDGWFKAITDTAERFVKAMRKGGAQ